MRGRKPSVCKKKLSKTACELQVLPSLRLASLNAGASPRTPVRLEDSCGGHKPPCVCTNLCVHRLLYALLCVWTTKFFLASPRFAKHGGGGGAPPFNDKTLVEGTNRLVCAPPCVCSALCVDRRTFPRFSPLRWTRGPAPAPLRAVLCWLDACSGAGSCGSVRARVRVL